MGSHIPEAIIREESGIVYLRMFIQIHHVVDLQAQRHYYMRAGERGGGRKRERRRGEKERQKEKCEEREEGKEMRGECTCTAWVIIFSHTNTRRGILYSFASISKSTTSSRRMSSYLFQSRYRGEERSSCKWTREAERREGEEGGRGRKPSSV